MNIKRIRFIYYIICPISQNVIYVGCTNNSMVRFKKHILEAKKGNKALIYFYIRFLLCKKIMPKFRIVRQIFKSYTESEYEEAAETEKFIETVLNEMYGNGMVIKKNKDLKKCFIEKKIDPFEFYNDKLNNIYVEYLKQKENKDLPF